MDFSLSDEHKALVESARRFVKERIVPVAAEADQTSKFPKDVFDEAWELGLVAPIIPEDCGGLGFHEMEHVLITEELAYGCTGIQTSMTANALAATPIILAGSDAIKKKYLGMLTSEPVFAAYAITEPAAGSDAAGIQMRAEKKGDDWVLNGEKCYITNGSWAKWYTVFATVDPTQRHKGIMAFVVDRDTPGISVGKKEDKLGQRASDTATIAFEDVVVPKENVLAEAGHGFKLAMQTFDRTRPDIGAGACGLMRRALDESIAFAKERKTFGVPIAEHQMVQAMLAEMAIKYEATRLLVHKAAWMIDQGSRNSLVASYSKAFGADSAMQVATDAVQVFGGAGYMKDYPVEKLMRDAKILQIYEGTSQIQRMVIARNILSGNR
ncbi:MAG: acyl-CoA dehydrogenase [Sandaracinus sp.]|nr:acyl-CoA dehydrogenase [Sandaracinus sp.]|tara:strand:- start:2538 stop:3683 length:1146 start_codon:yes stop_codon:yes gene_type:complete